MSRFLLERDHELAELGAAARRAGDGHGSVVLVTGEAGIGKSSVVEAVRSVLPAEGRLLVGYCDDLATPRVLGPLRDLIGKVGTTLTEALGSGDRTAVFEAIRAELDWPGHPTVLVVEDLHWADEATLDVLRFLVRRIAGLPAVLVATYRDDEIGGDHPVRGLLGVAAAAEVSPAAAGPAVPGGGAHSGRRRGRRAGLHDHVGQPVLRHRAEGGAGRRGAGHRRRGRARPPPGPRERDQGRAGPPRRDPVHRGALAGGRGGARRPGHARAGRAARHAARDPVPGGFPARADAAGR